MLTSNSLLVRVTLDLIHLHGKMTETSKAPSSTRQLTGTKLRSGSAVLKKSAILGGLDKIGLKNAQIGERTQALASLLLVSTKNREPRLHSIGIRFISLIWSKSSSSLMTDFDLFSRAEAK